MRTCAVGLERVTWAVGKVNWAVGKMLLLVGYWMNTLTFPEETQGNGTLHDAIVRGHFNFNLTG